MSYPPLTVAKKTISEAMADGVTRLAAAVAFYAVLSLAPLLLLSLYAVRLIFGESAARGELAGAIQAFADTRTAEALQQFIANIAEAKAETSTTILGLVIAVAGASGVFYQLKVAMNLIWDIPEDRKGRGWRHFVRLRVWGIVTAAVAIGFVVATVFATSALAHVARVIPEARWGDAAIWRSVAFLFTTFLYTILFSATYRYMPDLELQWRHVWKGGALTGLMASAAQYGIGAYLGRGMITSAYGAAGAVVVVLIWIYITSLILFIGAELTQILSRDDVALEHERRARQCEEHHVVRKPLP
jgi:membrane protein